VADLVFQPTRKWIRAQYWIVFLICCVAVGFYVNRFQDSSVAGLLLILPALLFIFPIRAQLRQRSTKVTITGDKLRYESGLLSKTERNIQISKVQDVRVDQSLGQRLMGIGNISIETAGESSRLTLVNIDEPRAVADRILDTSQNVPQKKGVRS
jgi:uncharacterized membrane protein YdbT with pleckstrin-like domain